MATKSDLILKRLQQTPKDKWNVHFWLVKRRLVAKQAHYNVFRVDTETKLKTKLRNLVLEKISQNYRIEEYSFVSEDQDDQLYTIEVAKTDFQMILLEIEKGLGNPKVTEYKELLNSWAYVVELRHGEQKVSALRKINSLTQPKKVRGIQWLLFQGTILEDAGDDQIFAIDKKIDLFASEEILFITNKKEFESALNFRKGMETNRDLVFQELQLMEIFQDLTPIRVAVGSKLNYLRKISAIKKSAYYKDANFMKALLKLNTSEKWGLTTDGDKIVATSENVDLVLNLLNNNRLKSMINQEVFDAVVKKKVE